MEKIIYNHPLFKDRRKELRKNSTKTEKILWDELRNKKINNLKFYRQYSVGPYILDFYSPSLRLALEIDGGYHDEINQKQYDRERDEYLNQNDIRVLRFMNHQIENNLNAVLLKITEFIKE